MGLDPWKGVRMVCIAGASDPTHGVDVTGSIEKGIASLREHRVYIQALGEDFDPESMLRSQAETSGILSGYRYAVNFKAIMLQGT